jgi:hypothetical protein
LDISDSDPFTSWFDWLAAQQWIMLMVVSGIFGFGLTYSL